MVLIDDLGLLPLKALIALFRTLHRQLMTELTDEDSLRRQLLELRISYELDEVDEEEYQQREAEIQGRLRLARRLRAEEAEQYG